ncbi:metallophosphoesterase [Crocosphaera sp. XPORK-15E]|uniref:metallophosphoesterase family protein n=1 Tax=Crocosphaera sp. XPORK-15E TaxID=3110247 RepID=UPI002B218F98|nr:metallophosphoesterase [Crocosphaera sp. XPORK-15E]MEA5534951.1 metallophosphoesterase [Crocosphaera sp. XPORK-15E]
MAYKRRQFLMITGGFLGVGMATITHQVFSRNQNLNPQPESAIAPQTPPVSQPVAVAPDGLFAPLKGQVRIVVISDLNSQYGSTTYEPEVDQAIALIPGWQPDLVLCGGDMIAGQKRSLTQGQIQAMWSAFDDHIAAPLRQAKIPLGFTIGNHDGSGSISQGKLTFKSERDLASVYWNDPNHNPGLNFIDRGNFPFYYTFKQQDIFYLVWDASTHIISPEQLTWVEQSLSSLEAKQAKLRLAIGHLPLYPVAVGRNDGGNFMYEGEKLQTLLEKYDVHTYVSGHHHAYYPGKKGQLELLHTGALGGGPRKLLNSNLAPQKSLTVVDISLEKAETTYTTYDMKTRKVIDIKTLPKSIGKVWRRDLVNLSSMSRVKIE